MHDGVPTEASWREHLLQVSGLSAAAETDPPAAAMRSAGSEGFDVACWKAAALGGAAPTGMDRSGDGALHAWDGQQAIEVWTEIELAAMHALWRLARRNADAGLRERLHRAVRWHLEHTQPDNATNRPWALHVFLREGSAEARHYAATLLHNAQALEARPGPLSCWILMDAACELSHSFGVPAAG